MTLKLKKRRSVFMCGVSGSTASKCLLQGLEVFLILFGGRGEGLASLAFKAGACFQICAITNAAGVRVDGSGSGSSGSSGGSSGSSGRRRAWRMRSNSITAVVDVLLVVLVVLIVGRFVIRKNDIPLLL